MIVTSAKHQILGGDQLLVILCGFGTKSLEFGISFLSMTISGAASYAYSGSILLTLLCCDDIHDVTPRVSALAGCDSKRCRICTIFSVVSWIISGPENSTNGTDSAKITRKRSKPDKHGHGNGKSTKEPEVSSKRRSTKGTDTQNATLAIRVPFIDPTTKINYPMIARNKGRRSKAQGERVRGLEASASSYKYKALLTHIGVDRSSVKN
ncbi:hypothetical protein Tco_0668337 [Tanacetum coccineum]